MPNRAKQWRSLPWLSHYEICEDGDVRRVTPMKTRKSMIYPKGRIIGGYRRYKLIANDGRKFTILAHRLVCEAWHGPAPIGYQVAHWDGSRLNNHFTNLRWATAAENMEDQKRHGTWPSGQLNGRARLNEDQIKQIRAKYTGKRGQIPQFSREYGLSRSAMWSICSGEHWQNVR